MMRTPEVSFLAIITAVLQEPIFISSYQVHYDLQMATVPYEPYCSKRKQYGWRRKDPIVFDTSGSVGLSLENALHHQSRGLEDPYDPVLDGCGDKVSFHIHVSVATPSTFPRV